MIKSRGLKQIIIAFVSVLVLALIGVLVVYIVENKTNKKYPTAGTYSFITEDGVIFYDFFLYVSELQEKLYNDEISVTEYNDIQLELSKAINNNVFLIDSKTALQYWAFAASNLGIETKLMIDVDFEGESFSISGLSGIFDGNGHTISNVKYSASVNCSKQIIAFMNTHTCTTYGLFCDLEEGAVVKNLRVKNVGSVEDFTYKSPDDSEHVIIGGLVGYATGGTILNCVVEDFIVKSNNETNSVHGLDEITSCGIFAAGYATVKNCFIKNASVDTYAHSVGPYNPSVHTWTISETYYYDWFYDVKPSTIEDVVVCNFSSKAQNYITPSISSIVFVLGSNVEYNHIVEGYYYPEGDKDYNVNNFNVLEYDFFDLNENYWYFPPTTEFNDGWPYPKQYHINLVDYSFQVTTAYSGKGFVTENGGPYVYKVVVKVPSTITPHFDKKQSTIFYGTKIEAVPNKGHIFYTWSKQTAYRYNALFNIENYNLIFDSVGGVTPKMYYKTSPNAYLDKISVGYDQAISYECVTTETKTIIKYNIANLYVAEYEFDSKWMADDYGLQDIILHGKIKDLDYKATYHIKPTVALKNYTIIFG